MKDIFICLVVITSIAGTSRYIYLIRKKKIAPVLSTWLIFFLGVAPSLATYLISQKSDWQTGILNIVDVADVLAVVLAIIFWGTREMRFRSFEKWYYASVATFIIYSIISQDAWRSNLFTQILITLGYGPTFHKLLTEKKNSESFTAWGLSLAACSFALYPALYEGNILSVLYASRAVLSVFFVLAIMAYYEFRP